MRKKASRSFLTDLRTDMVNFVSFSRPRCRAEEPEVRPIAGTASGGEEVKNKIRAPALENTSGPVDESVDDLE